MSRISAADLLIKLSELQESMRAVNGLPLILMTTDACERLGGQRLDRAQN